MINPAQGAYSHKHRLGIQYTGATYIYKYTEIQKSVANI